MGMYQLKKNILSDQKPKLESQNNYILHTENISRKSLHRVEQCEGNNSARKSRFDMVQEFHQDCENLTQPSMRFEVPLLPNKFQNFEKLDNLILRIESNHKFHVDNCYQLIQQDHYYLDVNHLHHQLDNIFQIQQIDYSSYNIFIIANLEMYKSKKSHE